MALTVTHAPVAGVNNPAWPVSDTVWEAAHIVTGWLWYDVLSYGAIGNGVVDDTAAIQAAIDACTAAGGGTVYFPSGIYACNDVALKSGVRLLGDGKTSVLRKNGGTTYIVDAEGTAGTSVSLNANGVEGASSVTAATNPAGIAVGDYVLIRDATYKYATTGRNLEINRVVAVTGTYTFTLANSLIGSYATASTAQIIKLNAVADATVEGLYFQGQPPTIAGGLLHLDYTYGARVRGCWFTGSNTLASILVIRSAHFRITENDIRDGYNTSVDSYGIVIGESSHNGVLTGNYSENIREHAFADNARCHLFSGNTMRNHLDDGVNTHGSGCERIVIANNFIDGVTTGYGIVVGQDTNNAADTDIIVTGNFIDNTWGHGISVASATAGHVISRVLVASNYVRNWGRSNSADNGIWIGGNGVGLVSNVQVVGNFLTGSTALDVNGIYAFGANDVSIINNHIRNVGSYGILVLGTASRVLVQGNHITAAAASNIYVSGTLTSLVVRNNIGDDATLTGTSIGIWEGNLWGSTPERNSGVISKANTNTITHGLARTPTRYGITTTVAKHIASITAVSSTTLTIALYDDAGAAVAVAENVAWWAEA